MAYRLTVKQSTEEENFVITAAVLFNWIALAEVNTSSEYV